MGTGGFSTARLARMSEVMRGYVERGEVAGVVTHLCRRDAVHVEIFGAQDLATGKPIARDTIFRIASMTKPVTAAAAMILVEETKLRLDDPVDRWLPELAQRRVLRTMEAPLEDVVPANRPITLRDLMTFRLGYGAVMAPPGRYPIQKAMSDAGLAPSAIPISLAPDEFMQRLGALPLMHQPGERWMYHTGSDILGVLIARAAGTTLETFLHERIFAPLGMRDTGFHVPQANLDRLATCYQRDTHSGKLVVWDEARGGRWARAPVFAAGGGGLVSTVDDFRSFGRMLLNWGRHGAQRILSRPSVELMTSDQLSAQQKADSPFYPGFWDSLGWGFGMAVTTRRGSIGESPGSYGWHGGYGTSWSNDPREDMVAVLMVQRLFTSPASRDINDDFFTLAYQAIDD
jgi:CubicO group peptidase (beta-lactamase class C family)